MAASGAVLHHPIALPRTILDNPLTLAPPSTLPARMLASSGFTNVGVQSLLLAGVMQQLKPTVRSLGARGSTSLEARHSGLA